MANATDKQISFIHSLLDEKELKGDADVADLKERARGLSKSQASEWISELLRRPRKGVTDAPTSPSDSTKYEAIPSGRYALEDPSDNLNPVKFYRIKHGGPSKHGGKDWTGFVFVDRYASDDLYPVKGATKYAVLDAIAENPLEAAQRYGREHHVCGICGRGLTRALSRELGIGPVCGARVGIPAEAVEAARAALVDRGIDPDHELTEQEIDAYWDRQMQLKELEEDERVAEYKANRDAHIISFGDNDNTEA